MAAHIVLDETMCKRSVCQHPQCWMTFRRIEQGHPRYRPLGSIARLPSQDEGGLPVLSVTTLPSNEYDLQSQASSVLEISRVSSPTVHNMYNSAASCSMDKVLFPGMNSFASPRKPSLVDIVDPGLKVAKSRHLSMVWVPNTKQKSPTKDNDKPKKLQIKHLTLTDMFGGAKGENRNISLPARRKHKPPTGGCPHNLTLSLSSPSVRGHTKSWMTASSVKEHPEEMTKSRRRLYDHYPDVDSQAPPALNSTLLENRPVILHDTRQRRQPSPSHVSPVYRLDEQFAALNNTEINLDSIRNQYYLWKKYADIERSRIKPPDLRADKGQRSHKLRAPGQLGFIGLFPYDLDSALSYHKHQPSQTPEGSVVCVTARSCDSQSRDSPSSTGFSQSSLTDVEPCTSPTELDTRTRSEQEVPEEGATEEECEIVQVLPDQEHLPGEEETARPIISPDPAESTNRSLEVTDVQDGPEQGVSSPQPNPPPPSPVRYTDCNTPQNPSTSLS
ncbi:uncharacterized protein C9orf43 homolog isoform X2 [Mixophyes fleayi]|uniref:uncharacterized protein C9orf43 homolog isoform X2 n=1 Tax=Mixophyes fleayi TaxID=3061075 RepID=UPI003F4DABEA